MGQLGRELRPYSSGAHLLLYVLRTAFPLPVFETSVKFILVVASCQELLQDRKFICRMFAIQIFIDGAFLDNRSRPGADSQFPIVCFFSIN